MKRKPLNRTPSCDHNSADDDSSLSSAKGWRQVGPSLFLHTASRLLVCTSHSIIRALNPLKLGSSHLSHKLYSDYKWICQNLNLLNNGYEQLLDLSVNFAVIKQPDFDFTRAVPIVKIKICTNCKQFATGNHVNLSKQEARREEHYKESPLCRDSRLIHCQGVATNQHPVTFLVFCDRRTEGLMTIGKRAEEEGKRKLIELKEFLEVVDINTKDTIEEAKLGSPRMLRRMSDISPTVEAEKRLGKPRRKLRRLSEIEQEVVKLADPEGSDEESTINVSDDPSDDDIVKNDSDEIVEEEDIIGAVNELFESEKEGPIDDPGSPEEHSFKSDTVEEVNIPPATAPQQSFAEFIYNAVNEKMTQLAESTNTKRKVKFDDMYKYVDSDPSVAKRRLAQMLLEFLRSELVSKPELSHLVLTHLHLTPLELLISDSNQMTCMGIQLTRVIGVSDLVFSVRINVFLERILNPLSPYGEAQTFETKNMSVIEVCSMIEMIHMVTAAIVTHVGLGYEISGYDVREVVSLCLDGVGLKDQASWVLFQHYLKNKRTW